MLDRSLPPAELAAEVAKLTGGAPVEVVFDAIALADTQTLGFGLLAPGGGLVMTHASVIPEDVLKAGPDKKVVNVFASMHFPENRELGVELYSRLEELLKTGAIVVRCRFCVVSLFHLFLRRMGKWRLAN